MDKKTLIMIALTTASFSAGVYFSDNIKDLISKHYIAQPGFYKQPYNLKVMLIKRNNKIESYLVDKVSMDYKPINENMETGCDCDDNVNKKLDFILKFYNILNIFY